MSAADLTIAAAAEALRSGELSATELTEAELLVIEEAESAPGWVGGLLAAWQSESAPSTCPSPSLSRSGQPS